MTAWRLGSVERDPDLGSDANFSPAKDWYTSCLEKHSKCARTLGNTVPTRLVDVGAPNFPEVPCLMITSELIEEGHRCEYLALSHWWGGNIASKTRSDNLQSMRTSMSMSSMPRNFRDARFPLSLD